MTDQQVDGLDAADDEVASIDVVTLLSDRGSGSEWVGTLHSILRQLAPAAAIIDLAHDVAVDDVKAASLALARSVQYLAPGVIVASVAADAEPAMRHIAVSAAGGNAIFVGPDNGVLASALAMVGGAEEAVILDRADLFLESPGTLDPGRDIYPAASGSIAVAIGRRLRSRRRDSGGGTPRRFACERRTRGTRSVGRFGDDPYR